MDKINDGGPAFPFVEPSTECNVANGMTLRDYFAAKAMQGMCAHPDTWGESTFEGVAQRAYEIADAMLRARGEA
ncbi:hypothetical protein L0Z11_11435 [Burkholderia multivorans]|uniref:hypothetical protein n=1 Tax=Burkholderia multivorans TaxID=87883 RepID=UPI002019116C|nr:hypothetical protein [Burkholderia multivorans]UQN68298.1 hypothetical protein L0Z45_11455 [Burkholderia multivorans]UQN74027.1 hypothetical protein L0Z11_11435 [Burkholderia multivorans]